MNSNPTGILVLEFFPRLISWIRWIFYSKIAKTKIYLSILTACHFSGWVWSFRWNFFAVHINQIFIFVTSRKVKIDPVSNKVRLSGLINRTNKKEVFAIYNNLQYKFAKYGKCRTKSEIWVLSNNRLLENGFGLPIKLVLKVSSRNQYFISSVCRVIMGISPWNWPRSWVLLYCCCQIHQSTLTTNFM